MSLEEIREKKQKFEQDVEQLLQTFKKETDTTISEIFVEYHDSSTIDFWTVIAKVNL